MKDKKQLHSLKAWELITLAIEAMAKVKGDLLSPPLSPATPLHFNIQLPSPSTDEYTETPQTPRPLTRSEGTHA